jgi:hypothetical protein
MQRTGKVTNAHLYAEQDVRSTPSLLSAVGRLDAELDRALALNQARRQRRRDADPRHQRAVDALYGRNKLAEHRA